MGQSSMRSASDKADGLLKPERLSHSSVWRLPMSCASHKIIQVVKVVRLYAKAGFHGMELRVMVLRGK